MSSTSKRKASGGSQAISKKVRDQMVNQRIALTWGDAGENHAGMEMVGHMMKAGTGFTSVDLRAVQTTYEEKGFATEFVDLSLFEPADSPLVRATSGPDCDFGEEQDGQRRVDAAVLIVRNAIPAKAATALGKELNALDWDTKYWDRRRQKVLNKHARSNLLFAHGKSQSPDYDKGKGTIYDIEKLPVLKEVEKRIWHKIKKGLRNSAGNTSWVPLICEGNNYFDASKCGIGYHGDSERTRVVCLSVGAKAYPMRWMWFHRGKIIRKPIEVRLNSGDVYMMSEKAVGQDWKKSSKCTLRHAAGADKYIKVQEKWRKSS